MTKQYDPIKFLEEAAKYFEHRPTNGEDRAHWANVYNAENCRKAIEEISRLKQKCDRQANILRWLTPENHPDTLFVSGVLGERDQNGMPEKLLVVPAYGVDFSYIYERTEKTTGPEW